MRRTVDEQPTEREPAAGAPPAPSPTPAPQAAAPPSSRGEAPSRTLGRYQLLFQIAKGGMGAVYAAVTRQEGGVERVFAVKVLHSGDRSAEDIEDFIQEAKLTSHIDHPNVLETFELGMQAGEPFLVMPLLRGVPLSRVLGSLRRRGERLPLELSVWIAAQVAGGLHAAHQITSPDGESLHVVHRDVSPQNVMLGYRGEVLLLDFGVAKLFESGKATASGVIKGKFAYMSPEQLRAEVVDRTTDVFALGVVLFEMLTGRPLFSDLSPPMAALRIHSDDTPRLSDHLASAPPALEEILARAMAKERRHRFQTALELRDALKAFLREAGAAADESQLADLITREFSRERAEFDERLRTALATRTEEPAASATTAQATAPPPLATSEVGPAPRRGGGLFTLGAVATLMGVAASLAWVVSSRTGSDEAGAAPPSTAAASSTTTQPVPAAPSGPTATASPSAPEEPATAAPSAGPSGARAAWRGPPRASASDTPPAPPPAAAATQPAPSASGVKGQPFRQW
ncbi:MAG: serine/threonine protein kinase [Polyangiaceae bacterium]|nr:serine/threonine protein kinase [Polyangiaceae bacterium]